ncbi:MAG TPA: hypothetical protein VK639_18435, partial [Terriglobales bacterium]|nr:hypothetical protein [Terriglobales bacterium]
MKLNLLSASLLMISGILCHAEDFEGPTPGWSVDGGTWELGVPISGPNLAHSPSRCAATVLAGDYAPNADSRLISPSFTVPAASANPRLRFWQWFEFSAG